MKKKINIYLLRLALLIFLISSCEKPIQNFELKDHDPKITANAILTVDSVAKVYIYRSKDLFDSDRTIFTISKPSVSLTQGSNIMELEMASEYSYQSLTARIIENATYEMKVSAAGYENVSATVSIPEKPEIGSIDTSFKMTTYPGCIDCSKEYFFTTDIRFKDNGGTDDFYQIELFLVYNSIVEEKPPTKIDFNTIAISPFIAYSGSSNRLYPSEINSEHEGSSFFLSDQSFNGRNITLSLYSEIYSFSNIPYAIDIGEEKEKIELPLPYLSIRLSRITKDLYVHLGALANNYSLGDIPLTEPVFIPTNIENGLGILGAKASTEIRVNLDDVYKQIGNLFPADGNIYID